MSGAPPEDPPPVGGTWARVYWALAIQLGLVVVGLYLLTRWAS